MNPTDVLRHRLVNQHLVGSKLEQPESVVALLVAMQAQEFAMARWAIAQRASGLLDHDVTAAFNAGRILRTHLLRPTWHFVTPRDIRWLLALTAPRVRAAMGTMDRKLGVDAALLRRTRQVIVRTLARESPLTRDELQAAFRAARIAHPEGPRLAHFVMHAELDGLICSGPRRDRKFTYDLLDRRAPDARVLGRDEALAELTRRYFASRGPATAQDFATWSGLTLTEVRRGMADLGSAFVTENVQGKVLVRPLRTPAPLPAKLPTFFMADYDEYGMSYRDRSALFGEISPPNVPPVYNRMVIIEGRVAGSWRRTQDGEDVEIDTVLDSPLSATRARALARAARSYGTFIGHKVVLKKRMR